MLIYKILRDQEWAQLRIDGQTLGAPIDRTDGYIHFSTAEQVAQTAAKHFTRMKGLHLAAVETDMLGESLKWETSRGGALFPHLYRALALREVVWCKPLPLGPDGHEFPDGLA